jgi:hypothetical protein
MNLPQAILAKPARWFAGACAVLGLLLVWAWLPGAEAPVIAPASVAVKAPHGKPAPDADADSEDSDKDSGSWAETILGRPLFALNRRPAKAHGGGPRIAASGLPRLSGIIIAGRSRRAIFMPDGGKPVVLAEGASIEDGTIRQIAVDRVVVASSKGDMTLYPSFDHNRTPPAPIVPTAPMFQGPYGAGTLPQGLPNNAAAQPADANSDDNDDSTPQPPVFRGPVPPPGGFRGTPMFPRGRPQ